MADFNPVDFHVEAPLGVTSIVRSRNVTEGRHIRSRIDDINCLRDAGILLEIERIASVQRTDPKPRAIAVGLRHAHAATPRPPRQSQGIGKIQECLWRRTSLFARLEPAVGDAVHRLKGQRINDGVGTLLAVGRKLIAVADHEGVTSSGKVCGKPSEEEFAPLRTAVRMADFNPVDFHIEAPLGVTSIVRSRNVAKGHHIRPRIDDINCLRDTGILLEIERIVSVQRTDPKPRAATIGLRHAHIAAPRPPRQSQRIGKILALRRRRTSLFALLEPAVGDEFNRRKLETRTCRNRHEHASAGCEIPTPRYRVAKSISCHNIHLLIWANARLVYPFFIICQFRIDVAPCTTVTPPFAAEMFGAEKRTTRLSPGMSET